MGDLTITIKDVHNVNIAGLTIAICVTLTRLGIRIRSKKLGWDDFWAAASIIGAVLLMTGVLIILDPKPWMSRASLVGGYYITSEGFYSIVWTSRLSILCTIIRIVPNHLRRVLHAVALSFGAMWIFLAMQAVLICEREPEWKDQVPPQCHLGKGVAIAQLTTDIIADLCLLVVPIHLFWNSMLPSGQRVRLNIVFSTCFLTTIVSLVHAYWIFANRGLNEIFTGILEVTISMIVASLNIIVGLLFRFATNISEIPGPSRGATSVELHSRGASAGPISVGIITTTYTDVEGGTKGSQSQDDDSLYRGGAKRPEIAQFQFRGY